MRLDRDEITADFLRQRDYPESRLSLVLEAIRTHHTSGQGRCLEAELLSDADALDFPGSIGVLRMYAMSARDLRKGYEAARRRREELPGLLCLEESRRLAAARLEEMDDVLEAVSLRSPGSRAPAATGRRAVRTNAGNRHARGVHADFAGLPTRARTSLSG